MKTISQKDLIQRIKEAGLEITGRHKPTTEEDAAENAKQLIERLDYLKTRFEVDNESISEAIQLSVEILLEMHKSQKADKKRKWHMDIIRDSEGLIKSIVARKI